MPSSDIGRSDSSRGSRRLPSASAITPTPRPPQSAPPIRRGSKSIDNALLSDVVRRSSAGAAADFDAASSASSSRVSGSRVSGVTSSASSIFDRFITEGDTFFYTPIVDGSMDYDENAGADDRHSRWLQGAPDTESRGAKDAVSNLIDATFKGIFVDLSNAILTARTTRTGVVKAGQHNMDAKERVTKLCDIILNCQDYESLKSLINEGKDSSIPISALGRATDYSSAYKEINGVLQSINLTLKGGLYPPAITGFFEQTPLILLRYAAGALKKRKNFNKDVEVKGRMVTSFLGKVDILKESLGFAIDVAYNQVKEVKSGRSVHIGVKEPALEGFQSAVVDHLKLPEKGRNLSRDQLHAIQDIDRAFAKGLQKKDDQIAGKAEIRLPTGAGKSWLNEIIATYYDSDREQRFNKIPGLDLYSSNADLAPLINFVDGKNLNGFKSDKVNYISIDENFFFSRQFVDNFWKSDGDEVFDIDNPQHLIKIESARVKFVRDLRKKGLIVFSWGASEESSKTRIEILRNRQKLKNINEEIEKLKISAKEERESSEKLEFSAVINELYGLVQNFESGYKLLDKRSDNNQVSPRAFGGNKNSDFKGLLNGLIEFAKEKNNIFIKDPRIKSALDAIAILDPESDKTHNTNRIRDILTPALISKITEVHKGNKALEVTTEKQSKLNSLRFEAERRLKRIEAKKAYLRGLEARHGATYNYIKDSTVNSDLVDGSDSDRIRESFRGFNDGVGQYITDRDLSDLGNDDVKLMELARELGVSGLVVTVKPKDYDSDVAGRSAVEPVVKFVTAEKVEFVALKTQKDNLTRKFAEFNDKRDGGVLCLFDKNNYVGGDYGILSRDVVKQVVGLSDKVSVNEYMQAFGRDRTLTGGSVKRVIISTDANSLDLAKTVKKNSQREDAVRTYAYIVAKADDSEELQDSATYEFLRGYMHDNQENAERHREVHLDDPESIALRLADTLDEWERKIDGHDIKKHPRDKSSMELDRDQDVSVRRGSSIADAAASSPHVVRDSASASVSRRRPAGVLDDIPEFAADDFDTKAQQDRLAAEQRAREEAEKRAEQDRLAREDAERKAREADKRAAEAAAKAERDRLAAEKRAREAEKRAADAAAEQDRLAREDAARRAQEADAEAARLELQRRVEAAEKAREEAARRAADAAAEQDRLAREADERERLAREEAARRDTEFKAMQDRLAAEQRAREDAEKRARELAEKNGGSAGVLAAMQVQLKALQDQLDRQNQEAAEKAEQDRLAAAEKAREETARRAAEQRAIEDAERRVREAEKRAADAAAEQVRLAREADERERLAREDVERRAREEVEAAEREKNSELERMRAALAAAEEARRRAEEEAAAAAARDDDEEEIDETEEEIEEVEEKIPDIDKDSLLNIIKDTAYLMFALRRDEAQDKHLLRNDLGKKIEGQNRAVTQRLLEVFEKRGIHNNLANAGTMIEFLRAIYDENKKEGDKKDADDKIQDIVDNVCGKGLVDVSDHGWKVRLTKDNICAIASICYNRVKSSVQVEDLRGILHDHNRDLYDIVKEEVVESAREVRSFNLKSYNNRVVKPKSSVYFPDAEPLIEEERGRGIDE